MLICPVPSKINQLAEELNSYSDAMQVYLLSDGEYPTGEEARKLRNRFKYDPYYTNLSRYEDNIRIYNNLTTNGLIIGTDRVELNRLATLMESMGFVVEGTEDNRVFSVQGSKKLRDTDTFGFNVKQPMFKAAEVSPIDFYGDKALLEQEEKASFNKTDTSVEATTAITKMLDKLSKRFGVSYEIIDSKKAKNIYNNYGGEKAFYYKKKVYLLEDGISLENALHEFSHPFIRAIAQKNVELFTNIIDDILSTPEGNAIYNTVKELYPEHIENGDLNYAGYEEVSVRALTAEAQKQYNTPAFESAVQRLIKAIRNLLRGVFSTNRVDSIDSNTSLKDLATILLGDDAYNLDLQDGTFAANKIEPPDIVARIKGWLVERRERVYASRKDTGQLSKLEKINEIEEYLKDLSIADTIINVVDEIYTRLADESNPDSYLKSLDNIVNDISNADTREKAEELINKIMVYKEYTRSLDIIKDLRVYVEGDRGLKDSTLDKFLKINDAITILTSKLENAGPYILAAANKGAINPELKKNIQAYMPMIKKAEAEIRELEAKGDKIKAAALKSKKEDLERKLGFPLIGDLNRIYLEAGDDISYFERMVKTVANTPDSAIGLFYKRYKEAYDNAIKKTNELSIKTFEAYKKFKVGKSVDNFKALYQDRGLIEEVNVLTYNTESGQLEESKEMWFTSEFDQNAYNLARKKAYDLAALEEKKARDAAENGDKNGYKTYMTNARRIKAKFRKDSTIAQDKLEGREKVIEVLKNKRKLYDNTTEGQKQFHIFVTNHLYSSELSEQYANKELDPDIMAEYGKALLDSYVKNDGAARVTGMFLVPNKEMFPNAKFFAMSAEDRTFHKQLLDTYLKSQQLLPSFERPGLRLPSIEKDIKDILIEQKDVKKSAVEAYERNFKNHLEDEAKGVVYKGKKKKVAIFFNQPMAADMVNLNITDTVLQFANMAEKFKLNSSLESLALLTKETLADRKVEKKTSSGKKILSALYKARFGEEKVEVEKFADTQAFKMFESWINKNIYNERRNAATLGNVRIDKVVDSLMNANALTVLGMDGLKAVANRLTAGTNIAIESFGSKYLSFKDLQKGKLEIYKLMYATGAEENLLMDTLKGVKTSKFGQLLDIYQAIQGENDAVDEIGGSLVKRNASTSLLMSGLSMGEFIAQSNMFAGVAMHTKVKTKSGETITLLEAYEKKDDGIVRLKDDVEFTLEDEQILRNKINAINKELHGVYNNLDEVEAKKDWVGRLLLQFRNFLVPNMERRFQELHVNFEMNDVVEGYYRTLYRKIRYEHGIKVWQLFNDKDLTENERNNLKKALVELSTYMVLTAMATILGAMGDDDDELKNNYAYNLAMYEVLRLKSEIGFFIPVVNIQQGDLLRIIKSPSSANTFLERSAKFSSQLFNPLEEYERKSGPWEKGDSKLKAKFLKLVLGYSGSNADPSIALENFKAITK